MTKLLKFKNIDYLTRLKVPSLNIFIPIVVKICKNRRKKGKPHQDDEKFERN